MKKTSQQKSAEPKDTEAPLPNTIREVAQQMNWGGAGRSLKPEPGKDRYFISAGGEQKPDPLDDPNWEPTMEDFALLAEMFRR
jgi:hypothetical protein